jgi:archaellum component FlaC
MRRFVLVSSLLLAAAGGSGCKEEHKKVIEKPAPVTPPDLDRAAEQAKQAARDLGAKATSFFDRATESLTEAGKRLRNATSDEAGKVSEQTRDTLDQLQHDVAEKTRQGAKTGSNAVKDEIDELSTKIKKGLDRLSNEAGPAAERTRRELADALDQLREKVAKLKD